MAPHGSELVVVQGTFSWARGVNYEAEWPGNERGGTAALTACGECAGGYAVTLGSDDTNQSGFVTLNHLEVPSSSSYKLSLHYVRNGLANRMVTVTVNDEKPQDVLLLMHTASWATLRVNLKKGMNRIRIQAAGPHKVYVDSANLSPSN